MRKQTSGEVRITKGFTRKQQAITALRAKGSEAARVTGIGTQRLRQEFDAADRAARRVSRGQAMVLLLQGSRAAVATLVRIMLDSGVPASTRLSAAEFVLGLAKDGLEHRAR